MRNWGVIEDSMGAIHVLPMIEIDGQAVFSSAHTVSAECVCQPEALLGDHRQRIWNHLDADHPGANR